VDRKDVTLETVVVPSNLTVDWMVATAVDLTSDGGCAACLCNTVGRAQEVYRALTLLAPEADLVLLHSKYTRADRRVHEDRVAKAFGRTGVRPARAIVVATQVIEQSLDLDFDVMLTEIAPMDLLLQRVGRVHRHARPRHRRLTEARLMVAVPAEVHARCYEPSSFVYEPLILGRTQLALQEHGPAVVLPEDVSPLVERVYGDTPVQPPPELEDLMSKWEATSMGGHQAELYVARDSVIPSPADVSDEPSVLAMGGLGSDADAPVLTRLARPSIGVAVLDGPITGSTDASGIRKIWESVVRIDWDHWYQHFQNLPLSDSWRRTAVLRDLRPAVFADGSYRDGNRVLHYSSDLGLYRTRIEGGHDTSI
jgi:CRISPR-associated endonuclease/helicase Cas3